MRTRPQEPEELLRLDAGAGPARPMAPRDAAALVDAALEQALGPQVIVPPVVLRPVRRPGGARRAVWLAAAALLVSGTAVAGVVAVRAFSAPEVEKLPPPEQAPAPAPGGAVDAPEQGAPEPQAPPPTPEEAELIMELEGDTLERKPPKRSGRSEADLLAEANAARGARRWRDADALYRQVAAEHPRSQAAHIALVASGDIHLEHLDDAAGAKTLYKRALAADGKGPLAAEARWGLARAARALGDGEGEKAAIESLLSLHPGSPLAKAARARLRELP